MNAGFDFVYTYNCMISRKFLIIDFTNCEKFEEKTLVVPESLLQARNCSRFTAVIWMWVIIVVSSMNANSVVNCSCIQSLTLYVKIYDKNASATKNEWRTQIIFFGLNLKKLRKRQFMSKLFNFIYLLTYHMKSSILLEEISHWHYL